MPLDMDEIQRKLALIDEQLAARGPTPPPGEHRALFFPALGLMTGSSCRIDFCAVCPLLTPRYRYGSG